MALGPLQQEFEQHAQMSAKLAAFKVDAELFGQKSGSIESVMHRSAAATFNAQAKYGDRAEEENKARFSDAMFLAMLSDIQDQIDDLSREIGKIDERIEAIDALLVIIAKDGQIDPTDPEQMRLLAKAGIDDRGWGSVDEEYLNSIRGAEVGRRLELVERRDEVIQELHKLEDQYELGPQNGETADEFVNRVIDGSSYAQALFADKSSDASIESAVGKEGGVNRENLETISSNSFSAFEASLGS